MVPEFAVEDLPLSTTAALVLEFAVKDLPLDRTLMMMMMMILLMIKLNYLLEEKHKIREHRLQNLYYTSFSNKISCF